MVYRVWFEGGILETSIPKLQDFAYCGSWTEVCTGLHCRFTPWLGSLPGPTKEMFMKIALAIAFGMVAVAPFFGRWRANVWLKKNMPAGRVVKSKSVPEAA